MPEVSYWESLFDIPRILDTMRLNKGAGCVVEFGCGYGSFTIPLARRLQGAGDSLLSFDIDPAMVQRAQDRVVREKLLRVTVKESQKSGEDLVEPQSADYVMLFNILHGKEPGERPEDLLQLAWSWLSPGGTVGIIHWRYDSSTPRGPSMEIRPRPEELLGRMKAAGFRIFPKSPLDLPPYHYGILGQKP